MAGQMVSVLGFWVQSVTLSLAAWKISGSPALLGLVNFVLFAPLGVIAPLYGPRVQPHNASVLTQRALAAQVLVSCVLCALSLAGRLGESALVLLATASGVVAALELPARQVLLASSVRERQHIGNAISMNTLVFNVSHVAGPVLASTLFAWGGPAPGFALAAVAVLYMITRVRAMEPAHAAAVHEPLPADEGQPPLNLPATPAAAPPATSSTTQRAGLRDALAYVAANRHARLFLPVVAALAILGVSYRTVVPMLADLVYHDLNRYTGVFFGTAGIGALAAALVLASQHGAVASRWLQTSLPWLVAACLGTLAAGVPAGVAAAVFGLMGFAITFVGPGTNAVLQQHAPAHLRGALVGLYVMCFAGAMPLGHLLVGWLATWLSVRQTLAVTACALALWLAVLFVPRWWRAGRVVLDSERL